jgi:hypothetical protein
MKRLFYSTVAVLAFSVSGMANNIEVDKLELNKNLESNIEEGISRDCQEEGDIWMAAILDNNPGHLSEKEVWKLAVSWGNVGIALCEGYSMSDVIE